MTEYYICYRDKVEFDFWDIFTCKYFRHCSVFWFDGYNWLSADYLGCFLNVEILPYSADDDVVKIMTGAGFIVQKTIRKENDRFIFRGWMTCVTVVKHFLGIRAAWVMTPKQLYNYLERRKP
jgi:hypothetical protein